MATGYVIPVDPSEIANRFHTDPTEEPSVVEELDDDAFRSILAQGNYEEKIAPLLDRIPVREADLINLYYIHRKRQADLAEIFGVTQAAISYRLDRGIKRIKFLLSIPHVTEEELRRDLPKVFKGIDVDILVGMWLTTCQSEVAKQLGLTQGRVRHRFFKAVKTLQEIVQVDTTFAPYEKIFSAISDKNFNILREVKLPQWLNRGENACL